MGPRRNRAVAVVAGVVSVATVAAAAYWAGLQALEPPSDPLARTPTVTVLAQRGSVGQSLSLTAVSTWPAEGELRSPATGTVTAVSEPGTELSSGETALTVDLVPIVIAMGAVPMFRDLGPGSRGPDVAQLEQFLTDRGHGLGTVDETWDTETTAAVNAWLEDLDLPPTGTVPRGMIAYTPKVPVRLRPTVTVGDQLAPGAPVGEILAAEPTFTVALADEQVSLIRPGSTVNVALGETTLNGRIGPISQDETGTNAVLEGTDGGALCVSPCPEVPANEASTWSATITVVPQQDGVVLPTAAIQTRADGGHAVILADGTEQPVKVVVSAGGRAVVEGVPEGTEVVLPAGPDGS